jgi:hypothetical protein
VTLADVETVVELVDPPVCASSNAMSPPGGGLSTPFPVKLTSLGSSSESFVSNCSVPVFVPKELGLKLTATFRLWLGVNVNEPPPLSIAYSLASAPSSVVELTSKSAVPSFVTTNVCDELFPTTTSP